MIEYDPGRYGLYFAFQLQGSVFPRALVPALLSTCITIVLHWTLRMNPGNLEKFGAGDAEASIMGGFTFILGFLVVFRSQQAYSRWWEGGTLLQQLRGEWFNSFSCLIAFCNAASDKRENVVKFQNQLVRLFSLLYGCALQQVGSMAEKRFELIHWEGLDIESLHFLSQSHDRCEIVLQWIQRLIVEMDEEGVLKIAPPILSRVFNELGNGIVNLNNARKITEFPIPFHLSQMITVMLLCHSISIPVVCAATVNTPAWAGVISFIVCFSYWSVHFISLELEMPFGDDDNDLPLHHMQRDMNSSLMMLMENKAQEVPKFTYSPSKMASLKRLEVDFDRLIASEDLQTYRRESMKIEGNIMLDLKNHDVQETDLERKGTEGWMGDIASEDIEVRLGIEQHCKSGPGHAAHADELAVAEAPPRSGQKTALPPVPGLAHAPSLAKDRVDQFIEPLRPDGDEGMKLPAGFTASRYMTKLSGLENVDLLADLGQRVEIQLARAVQQLEFLAAAAQSRSEGAPTEVLKTMRNI
eukprot:TRINITY_DN38808_c0_g1_i1.p1 TRINITY_DN38808_c0_g1~~TRINITY_DN38808_c0_g1_i1.p1  ORF type:complete len:566 (-),score=102.45 TRINITY_DN38808_c0_g1_i1:91-1668(-)